MLLLLPLPENGVKRLWMEPHNPTRCGPKSMLKAGWNNKCSLIGRLKKGKVQPKVTQEHKAAVESEGRAEAGINGNQIYL